VVPVSLRRERPLRRGVPVSLRREALRREVPVSLRRLEASAQRGASLPREVGGFCAEWCPSPMVRTFFAYTPPCVWYRGVHGGYPSRVCTVVYMVGIHHPPGICLLYHPGYTHHPTSLPCRHHPCWPAACSAGRGRGAQGGRNPWVGRNVRVNVDNPVSVGMSGCALLLRFSRVINNNDRIDEGCIPGISPMVWACGA